MAPQVEALWLVKNSSDRILGPLPTHRVVKLIERGELNEDAQISKYPGGVWSPISSEPIFYEAIIQVLSTGEKGAVDRIDASSEDAKPAGVEREGKPESGEADKTIPFSTRIYGRVQPEEGQKTKLWDEIERGENENKESAPKNPDAVSPSEAKKKESRGQRNRRPRSSRERDVESQRFSIIELLDLGARKRQTLRKAVFVLTGFAVVVVLITLLTSPEESRMRIGLLRPRWDNQNSMDSKTIKATYDKALQSFSLDTLEQYLKAQNHLVRLVEEAKGHIPSHTLLCVTYWRLWPFVKQDKDDLQTLSELVQRLSKVDPAGKDSTTCKVVESVMRFRFADASRTLDSALSQFPEAVFLYALKAYLLLQNKENWTAVGYLQSAQKLFPAWLYLAVSQADLLVMEKKFNEAANLYRQVLYKNHDHTYSLLKLGHLELRIFRKADAAKKSLLQGVSDEQGVPSAELSQGYLDLAEISLQEASREKALNFAKLAFQTSPANPEAKQLVLKLGGAAALKQTKVSAKQLVLEADQYVKEGDCKSAQALYKTAFEADKKNSLAALKAARCLWMMSFSVEAIDWAQKALFADPENIEAYVLLADYYTQRFDYLAGAQVLLKASRFAPRSHEVQRGYALIELRRDNPNGAINYAKRALQLYPTDLETIIIMTKSYIALRQFQDAYTFASRALELDSNNVEAQVVYAQSLSGLQGVDAAGEYLSELLIRQPLTLEYRLAWGDILLKDERYSEAQKVFYQVTQIDSKNKEGWLQLGRTLARQKLYSEALEVLLRAAVIDPSDARPLFEVGQIYMETAKPKEAMIQFERVLKTNKLYPRTHGLIGKAALLMGDYKRALKAAEEERKTNPNLADSYLLAGEAYTALKQYAQCAGEYQKAIRLRPQGADIYVRLAYCYRLAGNLDVAVVMLKRAAGIESGYPEIYKEQGAVYEMKGSTEEAIEAYEQYFLLAPNAPDRAEVEVKVQSLKKRGG